MSGRYSTEIEVRFWAKVAVIADEDSCWLWTARKDRNGYGYFTVRHAISVYAHRFSFAVCVGPISEGMNICHHCDRPPCVRPTHLFPGTDKDNMEDCIAKGRLANQQGEANHFAILRATDVLEIRRLCGSVPGPTQSAIALRFGVSKMTISNVVRFKTWRHI